MISYKQTKHNKKRQHNNTDDRQIPELHLVKYYSRAVDLVRKEGMPADKAPRAVRWGHPQQEAVS